MTKKKLSRQIGIKDMSVGELIRLFKGNELVSGKLTSLIDAIDNPVENDEPTAVVGTVITRTKADGSKVYDTQFYAGFKNGKQKLRKVTGKTFEDSQRKAWAKLNQIELTGSIPISKKQIAPTLSELLNLWMDSHSIEVELSTLEFYRKKLRPYILNPSGANAVLPRIGDIKVGSLSAEDIEQLFKAMIDRGLTSVTVNHLSTILSQALGYGIPRGYLKHNVMDIVTTPKLEIKESVFLNQIELSRMLDACVGNRIGSFVALAIHTGMRKSEVRALRWKDLNFDRGDIYIRRAMRYVVGKGLVMGDTKTQSSKRKIELTSDNMIFAMLSGLKAKGNERLRESGASVQEDDLIFAYPNGDPYGERYIENSFNEIKKKAMITKDGVGLHTLRHSYATLMLVLGVDVKDVSRTLGHSKVAITYDTYSHAIAGSHRKASSKFEETLKESSSIWI